MGLCLPHQIENRAISPPCPGEFRGKALPPSLINSSFSMGEAVSCPQVGLPKVGLHLVPQTELPEGRVMSVFPSLVSPGQVSAPTRSLGPVRARLCLPCSQAPLGHCHTSMPRPLCRELSKGQAVSPPQAGQPPPGGAVPPHQVRPASPLLWEPHPSHGLRPHSTGAPPALWPAHLLPAAAPWC